MVRKNSIKHRYLKTEIFTVFYSHLSMENITDANHPHWKWVCKDFERQYYGEYHDLYFQSEKLLLAHVFGFFKNMCLQIYGIDPANFFHLQD